ncbi:unnamed protein product [Closterium sp. NIES-54]
MSLLIATTVAHIATTVPHIATTVPHTATTVPHIATTVPHIATTVPHIATTVPHIATTVPHIATTVPHIATTVPLLSQVTPCTWLHSPPPLHPVGATPHAPALAARAGAVGREGRREEQSTHGYMSGRWNRMGGQDNKHINR